ncbi:PIN domain-containing protein [Paenibacillus sp. FSL R5-0810]|uniref:PIN domain-containing protein n=1 Tax=Paenibacillus sp. FSL R5-0810 TaxID=2921659 RepID=UPI0030F6D56C
MNIFLDTTNFYDDPFLKKIYNDKLIKICEENGLVLYVSRVVLDEAKALYKRKLEEQIKKLKETLVEYNQVPNIEPLTITLPDVQHAMEQFDTHYCELEARGVISIVEIDKELLPELIRRSIHRIKPFTENKQEFRDAVIWLSYAKIAEVENLEDCVLITANVSDYAHNNKLHPDLQGDSKRFRRFFKNTHGIIHSEEFKPYKTNYELQQWVENNSSSVTNAELLELLNTDQNVDIFYYNISDIVGDYSPSDVDDDFYDPGYVEMNGITIGSLLSFSFDVVGADILLTGYLEVIASVEASTDMTEGDYYHHDEVEIVYEVQFTAKYDYQTKEIDSLEVDDHWRTRTINNTVKEIEYDPDEYDDRF